MARLFSIWATFFPQPFWRGCGKGALEMTSRKCFEVMIGWRPTQAMAAGRRKQRAWPCPISAGPLRLECRLAPRGLGKTRP